jgi:hypothetical protein
MIIYNFYNSKLGSQDEMKMKFYIYFNLKIHVKFIFHNDICYHYL